MNWRKLNKILHRDIGYLAFGLTIVYSISGIAVNHVGDWNPNYIIDKNEIFVEPDLDSTKSVADMIAIVKDAIPELNEPKSTFKSAPNSIDLFYDGKSVSANFTTGKIRVETVSSRPVVRATNYLHLNAPKKMWTFVADLFALSLIILAITGLFMLKGEGGLKGRGKWLTALGVLIPIVFLIIYF